MLLVTVREDAVPDESRLIQQSSSDPEYLETHG